MDKILLQFLLVIFALGTFASGSVIKTLDNTDKFDVESTQHKLDFVVNVNRKIYYADNVGYYNWTGARENCQSNGMKLASITTEREKRGLERSYNRDTFTGSYWTSAWNSLEAS
ncbi:unnamed protein product [Orchesella dallaii]|uniref:C-type lectin domain-containing protein n=1 Tax=Orchesella dallaii TaxID=48710 RepID=A0ABP1QCW4_9HEXA